MSGEPLTRFVVDHPPRRDHAAGLVPFQGACFAIKFRCFVLDLGDLRVLQHEIALNVSSGQKEDGCRPHAQSVVQRIAGPRIACESEHRDPHQEVRANACQSMTHDSSPFLIDDLRS